MVTAFPHKLSVEFTPMKAGRPSYHIRSRWISVMWNGGLLYFELDTKGNLLNRQGSSSTPHHFVPGDQLKPEIDPLVLEPAQKPEIPVPEIIPPRSIDMQELPLIDEPFALPEWNFQDDEFFEFS
jgi:hypothetical protein